MKQTRTSHDDQLVSVMGDLTKRGFREPAMKRKSLLLARKVLQRTAISAQTFGAVMDAIETHAGCRNRWRELIKSAYVRLSKRNRTAVRFWMLLFYTGIHEYQTARRFVPKRFGGPFGFVELILTMETLLRTHCLKEAEMLIPRCQRAARDATHPLTRLGLYWLMGEYFSRIGGVGQGTQLLFQSEPARTR